MKHYLKTWPEPFDAVRGGAKRHEVRVNDRGFHEGDAVVLVEWDPILKACTGRVMHATIGHVSTGAEPWGLPDFLCVFTLLDVRTDLDEARRREAVSKIS